jgi:NADH-quinone oxidoreductase subunit D
MSDLLDAELNDLHTEPMILNMGPSHPAMHGTVRMVLTLDGETVVKCDPEIGYLHRGFEKECEHATWTQCFPYTDRLNYVSPLLNNFGFALAVEKLLEIKVPPRCDYIRTLMGEVSRISDHLTCLGAGALELGAFSAFLYAIEGRELIWDLHEMVSGARLTTNYARVGGLKNDLPEDFQHHWKIARDRVLEIHADIDRMTTRNRIFLDRMQGTGASRRRTRSATASPAPAYARRGWRTTCARTTRTLPTARWISTSRWARRVTTTTATSCGWRRSCSRSASWISAWRSCPGARSTATIRGWCLPDKEGRVQLDRGHDQPLQVHLRGRSRCRPARCIRYTEGGNGELGFYIVSNGTGKPWRVKRALAVLLHHVRGPQADRGRDDRRHHPHVRYDQHDRRRDRPLRASRKMPTCTINLDRTVEVERGTTVIQAAAERASTSRTSATTRRCRIPANCRMCLVDVEGAAQAAAGVLHRGADNMVVHTENAA